MATLSNAAAAGIARPAPVAPVAGELSLSDPRWHEFVVSHSEAAAFHRPEWAEMLADCYGWRPFVVAAFDAEGSIVGGLPVLELRGLRRRWVALPFSDYCPPLLTDGIGSAAFTQLLEDARRGAHVGSLAVHAMLDGNGTHPRCDAVLHTTTLDPDPEAVRMRFHRSQVQRNLRRAEREQKIVVRRAETEADLTRHYYRLHAQTRRRLGVPVQPRRFFEALWSHLLEPGHGSLLLAYSGSEPVAGAVFLAGTRTVTYKYGASDPAFWGLRPNHLLFWSAIRSACEEGYRSFDFGRTDLPDRGLRDFKAGWAAEEEPLVYTTLAEHAPEVGSGRGMAAARAVLRRSPTWVGRAAGGLLYRYAA
jgi:CelD/BcsL family acetyltransferase involved in cellulose biosynthesis